MKRRWCIGLLAVLLLLGAGCAPAAVPGSPESSVPPPAEPIAPPFALRGVWLSFLDLEPLLEGTDPTTAAARLDEVMDTCRQLGLNTVFFHARSHGDAYYASGVYPLAPAAAPLLERGFDPLAYAVEAAHSRGLSLHAWVNPYRLGDTAYGDSFEKAGIWYANPGSSDARARVLSGVKEILEGYPVDGIHFDDYFYPAGMAPEGEAFEAIPEGMDALLWRQTQVDLLVSGVYALCQQAGRQFGVSPMADIDRCRDEACADVARWMTQPGYLHYVCPQLYTGFTHESAPFDRLLARWTTLPRRPGVALYAGLALYKVGMEQDPYAGTGAGEWAAHSDILARQAEALKGATHGFVLFRYANLTSAAAETEIHNLLEVI